MSYSFNTRRILATKTMLIHLSRSAHHVGRKRLLSVDCLRGLAMVLVILQHSYLSVNRLLIAPFIDMLLWGFTYLAAVAFVSISGTMFSYFLYTHSNWTTVYRRYAARAAFLILCAGPAISLTTYFFRIAANASPPGSRSFWEQFIFYFPITDMIAVCLLVSPAFILRFGPVLRAVTLAAMLVATPFLVAYLNPAEKCLLILKEALFGTLRTPSLFWWPLVPWLAIFLAGSFAGQALANFKKGTLDLFSLVRKMNRAGIVLAFSSVILTIAYKLIRVAFDKDWNPNLFLAIYPGQTTTLLPGYFALLLWFLSALIYYIDISGRYDRSVWLLSILGRTSLFTFVVQFAVVESAPALLGLSKTLGLAGFSLLFLAGLTLMCLLSYLYGRLRGWFSKNDYAECVNAAENHRMPS